MNEHQDSNGKYNIESKLKYYMFVYQKTDSFRGSIYFRASIIFAICAFLMGSLWNIKCFTQPSSFRISDVAIFLILILFLVLSMLSLSYSIYSIHPFFWGTKVGKGGLHKGIRLQPGTSSFSYIAAISSTDYFKKQCLEMDDQKLLEDLLNGLYDLSIILNRRYEYLKKSYSYMFWAVFTYITLILCYFIGRLYGIWG